MIFDNGSNYWFCKMILIQQLGNLLNRLITDYEAVVNYIVSKKIDLNSYRIIIALIYYNSFLVAKNI